MNEIMKLFREHLTIPALSGAGMVFGVFQETNWIKLCARKFVSTLSDWIAHPAFGGPPACTDSTSGSWDLNDGIFTAFHDTSIPLDQAVFHDPSSWLVCTIPPFYWGRISQNWNPIRSWFPSRGNTSTWLIRWEDAVASVDVENLNHPKEWCRSSFNQSMGKTVPNYVVPDIIWWFGNEWWFLSSYMAMFRKKMLAIVICKSVSHFAPVIGILFTLCKAFLNQLLDWWSRTISNILRVHCTTNPYVFSFPSTFFSRVPTAKKCCTEKAKATMLDVTCAKRGKFQRRENRVDSFVMIFRPPFGSKPLPVLWTSNGGPRHEENGLWQNVRLEMMVENAVIMWEKHAIWQEPTKSEKDRRSTKAIQIIAEMFSKKTSH